MEANNLPGGTRLCHSCRKGVRCESSPLSDSRGRLFCTLSCAWSQAFRDEAAVAAAAAAAEAAVKKAAAAAAAEAAEAAAEKAAAEYIPIPSCAKPPRDPRKLKARRRQPEFEGLWEMDMDEEEDSQSLSGPAGEGMVTGSAVAEASKTL